MFTSPVHTGQVLPLVQRDGVFHYSSNHCIPRIVSRLPHVVLNPTAPNSQWKSRRITRREACLIYDLETNIVESLSTLSESEFCSVMASTMPTCAIVRTLSAARIISKVGGTSWAIRTTAHCVQCEQPCRSELTQEGYVQVGPGALSINSPNQTTITTTHQRQTLNSADHVRILLWHFCAGTHIRELRLDGDHGGLAKGASQRCASQGSSRSQHNDSTRNQGPVQASRTPKVLSLCPTMSASLSRTR